MCACSGCILSRPPAPTAVSPISPLPTARGVTSPTAVTRSLHLPMALKASTVATASPAATSVVVRPPPTAAAPPSSTARPPVASSTPAAAATPTVVLPAPSATPAPSRPKPPPSALQRLADYPRPADDDGYGFQINASPYPPSVEQLNREIIPTLRTLNAKWLTVWVTDGDHVDAIKTLVDGGFEVVLRLHPENAPPHPGFVPSPEVVRTYTRIGVHYFVAGNEPNLILENPTGSADDVARQWIAASDAIKAGGGIPLLYPMSPGGDKQPHREMFQAILSYLKSHDALDTLDGAGIAVHNRPHNKPLELRDSTSFLEYEWVDDQIRDLIGRSLPIIGTEAGYTYNDLVDPNFPRITDEMHRDYNLAIIDGFRDGRWRDALFAQNFWLLSGYGHYAFPADWWIANPLYFGKDLPVVQALKDHAPFVRTLRGN